jgi:hypothetical protein
VHIKFYCNSFIPPLYAFSYYFAINSNQVAATAAGLVFRDYWGGNKKTRKYSTGFTAVNFGVKMSENVEALAIKI